MQDYVEQMIREGYHKEEDFEPIKCVYCNSTDLKYTDFVFGELGVVEYRKVCKNCKNEVGYWSYGSWQV